MAAPVNQNVKVVEISRSKGKGLFACTPFKKGDVLFKEKPLVCAQFSWNQMYKYKACEFCLKSLETAEEMARRLSNNEELNLSHPECCDVNPSQFTKCLHCQMLYCSPACRDLAINQHHQALCLGQSRDDSNHPVNVLLETWRSFHYPPESTSIMLILKMIAMVKQANDKESILSQFSNFFKASVNEEDHFTHKLLGKDFVMQKDILRNHILEIMYEESVGEWYTPDGFNTLLALIGTNGQGIGSSSFSRWVKNVENLTLSEDERAAVDAEIDDVYSQMDEVSGDFLNCEGSGLYKLQSACNHSCVPNAEITFPNGDNTLELVALCDIAPEEEITISYLSDCDIERSRHSRQKALRENYLFQCTCHKCLSQKDDASVTSDDEEEEEEEMEA